MNNPFFVGRSIVNFTNDGKLFLLELTLTLPETNDDNTRKLNTFHQHFIMTPQQAKDFSNLLKDMISNYEKKFGKIKGKFGIKNLSDTKKKIDNYIG